MVEPTRVLPSVSETPGALDTKLISKEAESSAEDIKRTIRTAEWPSDIHGVLEKIAFRVHESYVKQGDERTMFINWEEAKNIFYRWAKRMPCIESEISLPEYLHKVLNEYAKTHKYCAGTDFDKWIIAQNELADSICKYCL